MSTALNAIRIFKTHFVKTTEGYFQENVWHLGTLVLSGLLFVFANS